ncbi:hypothetical protein [Devosia salina]|uniref:Uncharacterized protein n=1 Tax=Devosia salina TaxID=2860336 RepID=A0ABX8W8Q1_9HYPH|nr:hypothetical protein [Devosia salina]QYO75340.1 hypothetical protein K1X15_11840 [Devosia salina]
MTNSPGWAVSIEGEKVDLEDLAEWLKPPSSPWIETYENEGKLVYLLRSKQWSAFNEGADVIRDAERLVGLLHGQALLIQPDARPFKTGTVFRFGDAGNKQPVVVPISAKMTLSLGRVRVRIITGKKESTEPSRMQKWISDAESDSLKSDLFAHLARADNWFDLYKSMELAQRLLGGNKPAAKVIGSDWSEWTKVWQMANCARHAPDPVKYPLPDPPREFGPSRQFVLKVLTRIL